MREQKIIDSLIDWHRREPENIQVLSDLFGMCVHIENEDFEYAHKLNKTVRNESAKIAVQNNSIKHLELYKKSLLFDAPHELDAYLQYVEFDREPESKFYLPRRKQLLQVVQALQGLIDDDLDLVTVSMPPGTGKSTLGIFFLSWVMGKYPMQPNLASAHSAKLTRSFYDGVLQILTDPEYLYGDVFPTVKIVSQSAKDETIDLNRRKRFKTLTCRSIDGTLTGATRCEKILYADDLVSGIEEALSIDRLDSLWFKYTNDLKSRKKEGCKEVHIATRWSVHDPIGRLEREYLGNPRAKFIVLPALDENDESNFDYPYGVGFSTEYFHDMRNNLDDVSWRALYMNQPIEREGLVFPEDELNRYYELPKKEPDAIIGVCDTAEGGGDSVCLPVAYVYGDEVYIEDVVFNNSLPDVTKPLCVNILLKHKVQQCRFESNNAGGAFADDIQEEIEKRGGITHITKKRTTSNKLTRIIVNSDYVKKNFYFKDKSRYEPGSEYGRYMKELTSFTHAGKNAHDDAPDGTVMLVEFLQSLNMSKVEVFKRPF